jgi:hypothetical protein
MPSNEFDYGPERSTKVPDDIQEAIPSYFDTLGRSTPTYSPQTSSIGLFDTLPLELLVPILNLLDFRSLTRFSRVSRLGKATVEDLATYQALTRHAPGPLIALARLNLIVYHSAASLYAAFCSQKCFACQNDAPFLFLLTCDRCCYECVHTNPDLWLMEPVKASSFFWLQLKNVHKLPTMRAPLEANSKRSHLVSVKHVRELGITTWGSEEAMNAQVKWRPGKKLWKDTISSIYWLPQDTLKFQIRGTLGYNSIWSGTGFVLFPSLAKNGELTNGLWCCDHVCHGKRCKLHPRYIHGTNAQAYESLVRTINSTAMRARPQT